MTDPSKPPPVGTARASFTLLAALAAKLTPLEYGNELADDCKALGDKLEDMPLTPSELADALSYLASSRGTEGKAVMRRRRECVDLAEKLGVANGAAAGSRPPSADAIKAWAMAAEMTRDPDPLRELVELPAHAAGAASGKGAAKVTTGDGLVTGFLSSAEPDSKGQITITHVSVKDAMFQLPVAIVVEQQAALHKVAHPWATLGLILGDVGHGHPVAPTAGVRS